MTAGVVKRLALVGLVCVACGQTTTTEPGADDRQAGADAGSSSGGGDSACVFADQQLEAAVRAALKLADGPIPHSPAAELTTVSASGVATLAGIECLTKLQDLVALDGTISDLSPVSGLKRLSSLQLARNHVADLAPLSGLEELYRFGLSSNRVTTLSGLTLPVLRPCSEIHLEGNPIASAELVDACAVGWPVSWGGTNDDAIERCNDVCLK